MGEKLIRESGLSGISQLIGGNSKFGPDDIKSMIQGSIHGKFQVSAMLGVCCRGGGLDWGVSSSNPRNPLNKYKHFTSLSLVSSRVLDF